MDEKTIRALNAINRCFYRGAASEFAATREGPWPGWKRLLPFLEEQLSGRALRVLDVGCGNGRFAAFLAAELEGWRASVRYLGIDASAPLLEAVRARQLPLAEVETRLADIVEAPLGEILGSAAFSLIALFGVLHHLPGEDRRRELIHSLAERLEPGGLLALTSWQFEAFRRFRDKSRPWEEFNAAASEPIDLSQLEPGDHLLPWGEEGRSLRYCHFTDAAEMGRLVEGSGMRILATYAADGRGGNLNRYLIFRRGEGS